MPRVLCAGSEIPTGGSLSGILAGEGFEVRQLPDLCGAQSQIAIWEPDVLLLETLFSESEAIAICRSIRQAYDVPIVICSASGRESDIVRALDAGADDYLVMPVRPVELVARLRAVLRRVGGTHSRENKDRLAVGDLEVRLDEHRVLRRGVPVELSPLEFRLLACLAREAGRAVSHAKLMAQVWGPEYASCRHYLRLYIRYLRSKLEDDPKAPKLILSEWGVGYRLLCEAA